MYQKRCKMEAVAEQETTPINTGSTVQELLRVQRKDSIVDAQQIWPDPMVTPFAQRHILTAESSIFYGEPKVNAKLPMTSESIDPSVLLQKSLHPINKENVKDLLRLADKYQATVCTMKCIQFLKDILSVESVCFVLDVAWDSSWMVLAAIHGFCINIVYENFDAVIKTSGFSTCRPSTLQTILSQHPSNRHEFNVVDAVVKWARNTCAKNGIDSSSPQNLRKVIGADFCLIDFGAMTEIDFFTCQLEHRLLSLREVNDIVDKMSKN